MIFIKSKRFYGIHDHFCIFIFADNTKNEQFQKNAEAVQNMINNLKK